MEAKELRIGNYITSKSSSLDYWEVTASDIEHISDNPSHYAPIHLTEEWLVKLGFSINENYEHPNFDEYLLEGEFGIGNFNDKYWLVHDLDQSLGSPELKHVHQLQNLYFALTGEELTINE